MTKNVIYDNSKLLHSKLFLNNEGMKETETQLFFPEDLYYFELSFMYLCFPNGLTPRFILDFAVICFWNRVKKIKKSWFLDNYFSCSNFSNFSKFRKRFWYQLQQIFLINYPCFWSYSTFLLKFWYSITYLKHTISIAVYCLTCTITGVCQKVRDPVRKNNCFTFE